MNREIFKGHWNEIKGKLKQQWGKLSDDDLTQIDGRADELLGRLQRHYGYQKDQAEKELDAFLEKHHWTEKT